MEDYSINPFYQASVTNSMRIKRYVMRINSFGNKHVQNKQMDKKITHHKIKVGK